MRQVLHLLLAVVVLVLAYVTVSVPDAQAQSAEYQQFREALEGSDGNAMIERFQALPTEERDAAFLEIQTSIGGAVSNPDRLNAITELMNAVITNGWLFAAPVAVPEQSSMGTVRGTIRRTGSGRPVPGVRVTIGIQVDVTGPDGTFRVRDVPAGEWTASIRQNNDRSVILPEDWFDETTVDVTVVADEVTELVVDVGDPEVLLSGSLAGTVRDADTGDPIEEAIFRVAPLGTSLRDTLAATSVETDENGRFVVPDLPVGEVSVVLSGTTQAALLSNGIIYRPFMLTSTIVQDQTTGIEIALKVFRAPERAPTAAINGTVRDITTGEPIAGVWVGVGQRRGSSEADGQYRVARIAPGEPQIARVSHPGYVPVDIPLGALDAGITKRDITLFPIGLAAVQVRVTDVATGAAVPDALVAVGGRQGRTSDAGMLILFGIAAGEVTAQVSRDGYRPATSSTIVEEGDTGDIQIALDPVTDGTLLVTVLDAETGAPLPGVTVGVGEFAARTGADGRVRSPDVRAGSVVVSANAERYRDDTATATIIAGELTEITLRLDPITTGTLRVTVKDAETGDPLPGADVQIAGASARSDAQGIVLFTDRPAGDVTVFGTAPDYLDAAETVTIPRADKVSAALALEPITTGTVAVRVVDARNDTPLSEAAVVLGDQPGTTTGPGQFAFEQVPEGIVEARATAPLYKNGAAAVQVRRTKVTETVIRLDPILTGDVVVQVVNTRDEEPIAGASVTVAGVQGATDSEGLVRINDILAGPVSVQAVATVFEPGSETTNLARGAVAQVLIALEPITHGTVNIEVVDRATGQAIPSATLRLRDMQRIAHQNGTFAFERVQAGDLSVVASAGGYTDGATSTRLEPGQTQTVRVELEPIRPSTFSGRVADARTGLGIGGVEVRIGDQIIETDASGGFSVTGVPPGTAEIVLRHPQYAGQAARVDLPSAGEAAMDMALEPRSETVQDIAATIYTDGAIDLYGIFFDFGEDQFTQASLPTLEQVRSYVLETADARFVIEGHTDNKGSDAFNQDLSERRAANVVQWLAENGVAADRLRAEGVGESVPAASNGTEAGRALNRRVVLRAIE